jgi:hypothetical protein
MKFKIGDKVIINPDIIDRRKINPVATSMRKGVIIDIKDPYLVESCDYMGSVSGKYKEYFNDGNLNLDIEEIRNDKLKQIGI